MKIGVIGTGSIGGVLTKKWLEVGHSVSVANSRGVAGVQAFANKVGASAVDIYGAVNCVDLVVLSVPFPAIATLPKDLFENVSLNVPVIDTSNYYPGLRDHHIPDVR